MPFIRHAGIEIFYEVAGVGPPMLMLHGNATDHNLFCYQIARFSTWFRVIAPDLRGWGRSGAIKSPFSLREVAGDIAAVCENEQAVQAIVMGVSLGAKVALQMAVDRPELVRAVIAVSGAARPAERGTRNADKYRTLGMEKTLADQLSRVVTEDFAKSTLGNYLRKTIVERAHAFSWSGDAVAGLMEAAGTHDIRPLLPALRIPTLVINGEFDHSLPRGEEIARLIPAARHVILPGAGHCCNIENPDGFDALVLGFLADNNLLDVT